MKKNLTSIEKLIIKRMREARKDYDYYMAHECYRVAFESAVKFKEDVSLLYHVDVLNEIQFDLLYNLSYRMYQTAFNNTYIQ